MKIRRVDLQILWVSLDVLGPNDVQDKIKKEGRKKNKVSLSPFLFFFPSMLGCLFPRSRYPLLVPWQRVEITHL